MFLINYWKLKAQLNQVERYVWIHILFFCLWTVDNLFRAIGEVPLVFKNHWKQKEILQNDLQSGRFVLIRIKAADFLADEYSLSPRADS